MLSTTTTTTNALMSAAAAGTSTYPEKMLNWLAGYGVSVDMLPSSLVNVMKKYWSIDSPYLYELETKFHEVIRDFNVIPEINSLNFGELSSIVENFTEKIHESYTAANYAFRKYRINRPPHWASSFDELEDEDGHIERIYAEKVLSGEFSNDDTESVILGTHKEDEYDDYNFEEEIMSEMADSDNGEDVEEPDLEELAELLPVWAERYIPDWADGDVPEWAIHPEDEPEAETKPEPKSKPEAESEPSIWRFEPDRPIHAYFHDKEQAELFMIVMFVDNGWIYSELIPDRLYKYLITDESFASVKLAVDKIRELDIENEKNAQIEEICDELLEFVLSQQGELPYAYLYVARFVLKRIGSLIGRDYSHVYIE